MSTRGNPQVTFRLDRETRATQREASNIPATDTARYAARVNLQENGATAEEIEYLLDQRVELNAFTSDALVAWLERKLVEHGVKKVIPDDATLVKAYQRAKEHAAVQTLINEAVKARRESAAVSAVPANLGTWFERALNDNPERAWDSIVMEVAGSE